jgi:hypothetical protein
VALQIAPISRAWYSVERALQSLQNNAYSQPRRGGSVDLAGLICVCVGGGREGAVPLPELRHRHVLPADVHHGQSLHSIKLVDRVVVVCVR